MISFGDVLPSDIGRKTGILCALCDGVLVDEVRGVLSLFFALSKGRWLAISFVFWFFFLKLIIS